MFEKLPRTAGEADDGRIFGAAVDSLVLRGHLYFSGSDKNRTVSFLSDSSI